GEGNAVQDSRPDSSINRQFDPLNRIKTASYSALAGNAASIHTTYDPNGNPTTVLLDQDSRNLAIHRSYDDQNRLEREEADVGASTNVPNYTHTQRYALDGNGNRVAVTDAANTTTQHTFDAQNRLLSSTTAGEGSTTTRWNKNGTLQSIDHGNGSSTRYQYDRAQRIQEITHTQNGATTLAFAYQYDANGNRSQETRTQSAINGQAGSVQTTTYAYDRDDRLIQTTVTHQPSDASTPDERTDWTLDAVGNRLTETVTRLPDNTTTSNKSYVYSDRDQLTLMTDSINQLSVEYAYDQNGNRTQRTVTCQGQPPETTTYTFDARDRLTGVQPNAPNTANAPSIAYQYDADGRRIERIAFPATGQNPAATLYLYNGSSLLHEAIPDGAASSANASGLRLTDTYRTSAKLDRHLAFDLAGNASVRFYQLDALDTPVAMTDPNGNTVTRTTFDAWGNIEQQIANGAVQTSWQLPNYNPDQTGQAALLTNDGQLIGFTGYQKDSDTGLYYAGARWYDALTGSFNGMDPAQGNPQWPISFHRYVFGNGNPTIYIDPSGRIAVLANGANMLAGWNEWLGNRVNQVDQGKVGAGVAVGVGIGRGFLALTEGALRGVNAVANLGVVASASVVESATGNLPQFAEGAAAELVGTQEATVAAVDFVRDDGVFKTYDAAVARTTEAFEGNNGAISDVALTLTTLTAPVVGRGNPSSALTQNLQQRARQLTESARNLAANQVQGLKNAARGALGVVEDASGLGKRFEISVDAGVIDDLGEAFGVARPRGIDVEHAPDIEVPFGAGIGKQGFAFEDQLAARLPPESRLAPGTKTFDFLDRETGVATSAKTLNTTTPSRLAKPASVGSTLRGNVNAAANFERARGVRAALSSDLIDFRVVQVAVPLETTAEQWEQIFRALQFAKEQSVKLKPIVVTNSAK
ncbi:MAG: RHS repeat-associated core domain-containing protein, partial [Lysobacterales bacterium]